MRLRTTARWALVLAAVAGLLLAVGGGARTPVRVAAGQPDVYQATAMSAATDTRSYQTGSPVDPAPAVNTATPLASITADNGPKTEAHAAYAEPPQLAQAATGLNNVPVPYVTQAESLCANCPARVSHDAEGDAASSFNGSRVAVSGGTAHTEAGLLDATARAATGKQTIGSTDQLATLYQATVSDIYGQINHPNAPPPSPVPAPGPPPSQLAAPPPCQTPVPPPPQPPAPLAPLPSQTPSICAAGALPLTNTMAEVAASDALTTITTGDTGTVVDTSSVARNLQLLDGMITIGSIRTEVRASGDGTDADSAITAINDIQQVCVAGACGYSLTADGICALGTPAQACANDPVNQQLRAGGFNVCRLGTATDGEHTSMVTGTVAGVLVEWHAIVDSANGNVSPDAHYYDGFKGDCDSGSPTPRPDFAGGFSSYTVIGESSVQLLTRVFPGCTGCPPAPTEEPVAADSGSTDTGLPVAAAPGNPGSITTTIRSVVTSGGARQGLPAALAAQEGVITIPPGPDRRPLELIAFGCLELVLLLNLTAMARARAGRAP